METGNESEEQEQDEERKTENWHEVQARLIKQGDTKKARDWDTQQLKFMKFAERQFDTYQRQCLTDSKDFLDTWKSAGTLPAKQVLVATARPELVHRIAIL